MGMLPVDRLRVTLNHHEPDKVPLDLGGRVSGIHVRTYRRVLDLLGIDDPHVQFYDFGQQLVVPCEALLERFEIDTRYLYPPAAILPESYTPGVEGRWVGFYDQFGVFWGNDARKDVDDILYYDPVIHPLADATSPREVHAHDWPDGTDKRPLRGLRDLARQARADPRHFGLVSTTLGCIYEYTTFLFGFTTALKHLRRRPELIVAAMEELLRYWMDFSRAYLEEVAGAVDVACINGDLADQGGPLINPRLYEDLAFPFERRLSRHVHALVDAKVNYHCCGSTPAFLPLFVRLGFDAYNPVQVGARDMEPCSLKRRFGRDIVFWGGACDTQSTLPFGSPAQVRAEVRRNLACFKPGGGYVAANIHNLTAEVPARNVVALFDALREFRAYA